MSVDTPHLTFISYSRADKDFALALARELKQSGFRIWLDQLDIPTGSRWDDEIENALKSCDVFLIILTHHSVASPNVRDEINYALGKNKRVVPILLESVDMPFRIHRVQYVDFTNRSHQEGLDDVKRLLQQILNGLPPIKDLPVKQVITSDPPPPTWPDRTRTLFFIGGLGLLSITCVVAILIIAPNLQKYFSGASAVLVTSGPSSNIIAAPTTAVVASPMPSPSDLPTSTNEPTLTFTATVTPTLTPVDTPTTTPFSPAEPDQFMNFYFETIIYQRDFELGWSLLSDRFKTANNSAGFEDWKATWEKVYEWTRPAWSVRYASPTTAYVSASEIWFRGQSWYSLTNREYCVVRDESRNTWMIESSTVCGQ